MGRSIKHEGVSYFTATSLSLARVPHAARRNARDVSEEGRTERAAVLLGVCADFDSFFGGYQLRT